MDKLDIYFEKQLSNMSEREQEFFIKMKNLWFKFYGFIKPFLIGMFMLWLFTRIKNLIGLEEATYIVLIIQLIFLRQLLSKFS